MPKLALSGLVVGVLLSVSMTPQDPKTDVETLRRLIQETATAIKANDAAGIMAHYSKDIIVSYPGRPDTTYDEFDRSYRQMLAPNTTTNAVPTIDEILVSGDLAVIRMRWNTTIVDKVTGGSTSRQAKDLQVWRRENDRWKFFRGMWYHVQPG